MPATVDNKGIHSGWSTDEDDWGALMNQNMRVISALVMSGFAQDLLATSGLTYGFRAGTGVNASGLIQVAAGTLTLPPNATSYIVRTVAGVVSSQTSASFPDRIHLATVVTNVSNITSIVDERYVQDVTQNGTLTARNIQALGTGTFSGAVTALKVNTLNAAAPNNAIDFNGFFASGVDATLGPLYAALGVSPSPVGANRFAVLQIGDNATLRKLGLKASQTYIGTNDPTFIGAERLRVEGAVRVDNAVTAASFTGLGTGLTDIPSAAVVGLDPFVSNAIAAIAAASSAASAAQTTANAGVTNAAAALAAANAAQATANGKANTIHTHNASAIDAGRLDAERITLPTISPTGAATGIQRPQDGWNAYDINFIKISPTQYIPVFTGFNI